MASSARAAHAARPAVGGAEPKRGGPTTSPKYAPSVLATNPLMLAIHLFFFIPAGDGEPTHQDDRQHGLHDAHRRPAPRPLRPRLLRRWVLVGGWAGWGGGEVGAWRRTACCCRRGFPTGAAAASAALPCKRVPPHRPPFLPATPSPSRSHAQRPARGRPALRQGRLLARGAAPLRDQGAWAVGLLAADRRRLLGASAVQAQPS